MIRPRMCFGRGGADIGARLRPGPSFLARQYASVSETSQPSPPPASTSTSPGETPVPRVNPNWATQKASRSTAIIRTYKPRTPGMRHLRRPINDHLWKGRPHLPLTFPKKGQGKGGRNAHGKITVRHRGGGAKRRIRTVDFERWRPGPHIVDRIEYDPGRSAHIALVTEKATGRKTYILAADGLRAGDIVQSYRSGIPKSLLNSMGGVIDPGILAAKTVFKGNCLPVHLIPVGTVVFNVGSRLKGPAVFCRSAGTHATIVGKEEETRDDGTKVMTGMYVNVQLQSGEIRRVHKDACATIGVSSNPHHQYRQLGKAGRSRWLNIRPTVRGVAMNRGKYPPARSLLLKSDASLESQLTCKQWITLMAVAVAKGGFKTRRKHNHNKWVVVPRVRNVEKRRAKNAKD